MSKPNKQESEDFSSFLDKKNTPSNKENLLSECKKNGVSPYVDDPSETHSGFYAEFRTVASEAELERRLNVYKALCNEKHSKIIAIFALFVSTVALIRSFI